MDLVRQILDRMELFRAGLPAGRPC
jgi:hypothetical protein